MIGFSLVHGYYGFLLLFPFILLVWLVAALCVTVVAVWRKKRVSLKRWVSICLTILILTVSSLPYSFWQRLFVDRISSGPHAVDFLNYAAATGDLSTVRALLSHGVLVNISVPWDGNTALHSAAVGGHMNIVEYLISKGFKINAVNRLGDSPLEKALSMGNDEVAKFLSDHGALQIRGDDTNRDSVLSQMVREDSERTKSLRDPQFR